MGRRKVMGIKTSIIFRFNTIDYRLTIENIFIDRASPTAKVMDDQLIDYEITEVYNEKRKVHGAECINVKIAAIADEELDNKILKQIQIDERLKEMG